MRQYWLALGREGDALRTPSRCNSALPLLPPMVVVTASHDILRDEAEDFAGMVHGFARMVAASPAARQHVEAACAMLQQLAPAAPSI